MDPKPGDALGGYVVTERLVAGGMARVFRGRQSSTGREVAIKVLTLDADPDLRARFEHEARVLATLQHPHILGLIDAGREGEWLYLIMPLVRCGDLADLIAREDGPLPLPQLRRTMLQLCAALDYAHSQGVVHRDVKPANVLLDERGNCLLTDFGIALSADAKRLTIAGFYIGTPEYLPPEQSAGRVDARSDLYSLGVVLFQMATGRLPFTAHTPLDWLRAHNDTPVPAARSINAQVPPALEQVINKALAKTPEARYQSAAQFAAAIRDALPESTYGEDRTSSRERATVVSPRAGTGARSRVRLLLVLAAIVIVSVVAFAVLRAPSKQPALAAPAGTSSTGSATASPVPIQASTNSPDTAAALFDDFDDVRYDGKYDPARWHATKADARMQIAQRDGALHIRSQEREHGVYAEFPATRLDCVSARVRLDAPVRAQEAGIGISLSRSDRPGEWVSCYLYATRGAANATPACTDQRRQEFRTGDAGELGLWHTLTLHLNSDANHVIGSADGRVLGTLPSAGAGGTATWYLLLSGWSSDGQPVEGDIDDVRRNCAD